MSAKEEDLTRTSHGEDVTCARPWLVYMWRLYPLALITALPVALASNLWLLLWQGIRPRGWDGSGHYALAQIYDQSIFPDTFGWTNAYFGGMPFPNFYPPVFYWCVALFHHTHLVSFTTAFKLMVMLPTLLLPAAIWTLAWAVSDKNRIVGTWAALASLLPLIHPRFQTGFSMGLDYLSTFDMGMYSQPLGFVLLVAWYVVYLGADRRRWQFALACLLLALAVLANFTSVILAAMFVAATVIHDAVRYYSAPDLQRRKEARSALVAHFILPLVAACLSLFWLVPMLSDYEYFVTRPSIAPLRAMFRYAHWAWYMLAGLGITFWLRRPTHAMWPFLATCLALASGLIFSSTIAPRWFPLQSNRFLSMLNFLLAVPIGHAASAAFQGLAAMLGKPLTDQLKLRRDAKSLTLLAVATGVALVLLGVFRLNQPVRYPFKGADGQLFDVFAFHSAADNERIEGVLRFARQHLDGRYLVEVPRRDLVYPGDKIDSRGISAYLGAQGNETLSFSYREASPNALFFIPVNRFSGNRDAYGISSVLAEDLDFAEQPLGRHLERARLLGTKYLVICSPQIKDQLAQEPLVGAKHDFDGWSVFELRHDPPPRVSALSFRPALVVGNFSLKGRRRNEYDFVRLAEEQFSDGWFDVLLVRSNELKIDRLRELDQFGALILDTYECDDENLAFERLRDFARRRPLILLSSETALFHRIRTAIADFPLAEVIERSPEEPGEWVYEGSVWSLEPSFRYGSSAIRKEWEGIRRALDRGKVVTDTAATALTSEIEQTAIRISPAAPSPNSIPVLIATTYHPNWHRDDGDTVYAATPFFMVTFVRGPSYLIYSRGWFDGAGLFASASTLILLGCFVGWGRLRRSGAVFSGKSR